jgi:thioredoxin-related protein
MKEFMLGQKDITGSFIDASTPEGLNEARKYNVAAVPTVVFVDDAENELHRCSDKMDVTEFLNK